MTFYRVIKSETYHSVWTHASQFIKRLCPKKPYHRLKSLSENLYASIHQMPNNLLNLRHTLSTYITLLLVKIIYYKAYFIKKSLSYACILFNSMMKAAKTKNNRLYLLVCVYVTLYILRLRNPKPRHPQSGSVSN